MSLKLLLIQPPLTDPTGSCAALPALSAYVEAYSNHTGNCLDANLESIYNLLQPSSVRKVLDRISLELGDFNRYYVNSGLSFESVSRRLVDLYLASTLSESDPLNGVRIFRDPLLFYEYQAYYWAATTLQKWLGALAPREIPRLYMNFGIRENEAEVNCRNLKNLLQPDMLELFIGPFAEYFDNKLIQKVRKGNYDVVGLSISFHHQLPFAIRICRSIRAKLPHIVLLLGGTEISQLWKYGKSTGAVLRILKESDAIVIGEGEIALVKILDAIEADKPLDNIQNTICLNNVDDVHTRHYIDLRILPPPAAEKLPLQSYLAPEALLHYAPTRGCYWNRCAFCDYGLSENSPTAPWRERPTEAVLEDLIYLRRYARFIYFSVDTISPRYLASLAKRIIANGLDIRWGAEIRLDLPLQHDFYKLLRESGCVAMSVGFESASQRILDLMDKGTQINHMLANIREMAKAGIGVQIMGFTGFPTETFDEAIESIKILNEISDSWVFGTLGQFQLTAGAFVAKNPKKFGIKNLRFRSDDDLLCLVDYDEELPSKIPEENSEVLQLSSRLNKPYQLGRPFAGGIDAAHTLMYINRYSLSVTKELEKARCGEAFNMNQQVILGGVPTDWWPASEDMKADPEPSCGYYLITNERSVLSCSKEVGEVALLLLKPRTFGEVMNEIIKKPLTERLFLITGLKVLMKSGLIRPLPKFDRIFDKSGHQAKIR